MRMVAILNVRVRPIATNLQNDRSKEYADQWQQFVCYIQVAV